MDWISSAIILPKLDYDNTLNSEDPFLSVDVDVMLEDGSVVVTCYDYAMGRWDCLCNEDVSSTYWRYLCK